MPQLLPRRITVRKERELRFVRDLRLAARELPDGMNCPGDMNCPAGHRGAIPFMERSEIAFIRGKN